MKARYGRFDNRLIAVYPAGSGTVAKTARDLTRDAMFGWHTWVWARLQAKTGKGKVRKPWPPTGQISPKRGDPNGQGVPTWPTSAAPDPPVITSRNPHTGPVPSAGALKVLDEYFAWRRTPEGEAFVKYAYSGSRGILPLGRLDPRLL